LIPASGESSQSDADQIAAPYKRLLCGGGDADKHIERPILIAYKDCAQGVGLWQLPKSQNVEPSLGRGFTSTTVRGATNSHTRLAMFDTDRFAPADASIMIAEGLTK
jgi:hypothetical protein